MDTSNVDRILAAWDQVADARPRPLVAPRPVAARGSFSMTSLVGLGIVAAGIMIAIVSLGRPTPDGGVGTLPTTAPSERASAVPTSVPTATPSATASPLAVLACRADQLTARIRSWEGAAGHRTADVELANTSQAPCVVPVWTRPQLVDGSGALLIDGADQRSPSTLTFDAGARLDTLVQDGDYCGPAPVAPVTLAFLIGDARVVATPPSPTDATVPPCLSGPGSAGTIEMQGWSR